MKTKSEIVLVQNQPQSGIERPSEKPRFTRQDVEDLADVLQDARAENTARAYESDWALFEKFCESRATPSRPALPEVVAAYLTALARGRIPGQAGKLFARKLNTIRRHLATISVRHTEAGLPSPRFDPHVQVTMKAIARGIPASNRKVSKQALTIELLDRVIRTLPDDCFRIQHRAALSHGFHSGGRRRSEITGTNIEDVNVTPDVTYILLTESKTDQAKQGFMTRIPRNGSDTCPAAAIDALLADLKQQGFTKGPLYRKMVDGVYIDERLPALEVANIVKAGATRIGLDPKVFAGHSLRSGFITSAVKAGIGIFDIKQETGHKTTEALAIYVQSIAASAEELPSVKITKAFANPASKKNV